MSIVEVFHIFVQSFSNKFIIKKEKRISINFILIEPSFQA